MMADEEHMCPEKVSIHFPDPTPLATFQFSPYYNFNPRAISFQTTL